MTLAAGGIDARVRIERRARGADDGYGNVEEEWSTVAIVWAGWRPEFGREVLAAGQLADQRRGTLSVRASAVTRTLGPADRIVFLTGPEKDRVFNVRSVVPGAERLEAVCETGVAT